MRLKKKILNWLAYVVIRGDYFLFGLIFIKKIIKPNLKKKQKPIQTDRFWFGFLEQKPVQTGLVRFFLFGSIFSVWFGFFRFVLVLFLFFLFGFGSILFFYSRLIKPKSNRSDWFF